MYIICNECTSAEPSLLHDMTQGIMAVTVMYMYLKVIIICWYIFRDFGLNIFYEY